jgi:hypothetical protein
MWRWLSIVWMILAVGMTGCLSPGESEPIQRTSTAPADTSGVTAADLSDIADGEEVVTPPPLCLVDAGVGEVSYDSEVKPILTKAGCFGCHSGGTPENLVGLPGTSGTGRRTKLPIVAPCDPSGSALFLVISSGCTAQEAGVGKMPPGSQGLTAADTEIVQRWIAQGGAATFDAAACP